MAAREAGRAVTAIRLGNLAWHLGGDARLVYRLAAGVDVLVLVECRTRDNQPIDIAKILGPKWRVWQDLHDAARAGTAIAVRRNSTVRVRRSAGTASRLLRLSVPGRRVQTRHLRDVKLRDHRGPFTVAGAHLPLKSTDRQDDAERALAGWWRRTRGRRLAMGDGNQPHHQLRADIGGHASAGADVMFAIWSTGWGDVDVHPGRVNDTDHHVLTLRTRPTRTQETR